MDKKAKWKTLILILVLFLWPFSQINAEEGAQEAKKYEFEFSVGGSVNDYDDAPNRAAEYKSIVDMDSSWYLGGSLKYFDERFRFQAEGKYEDVNEQEYRGALDLNRVVLFRTDYNRFYHRLDHDHLTNLEAHSMEELFTKTKGSLTKWVSKPKGAGLATVYHDDFDAGDHYGITRSLWKNNLKINLPGLPGVSFELAHRYEERGGLDQARTMSKCAACHVVAKSKAINEFTNDWNPRINANLGKLSVQYSFLYRTFGSSSDVPYNIYNEAMRPVAGDGKKVKPGAGFLFFDAEVQFDQSNGPLPFARTPDTKKWMHVIKAKYDFNPERHFFISYVNSDIQNVDTDEGLNQLYGNVDKELDIQYNAIMARFYTKLGKRFTLTLKGKYMNMDGDDVHLDVNEMRLPDNYPKAPGKTYREVIGCTCDITRYSSYDVDEYTFESDLAWKVNRQLKLFFGYEFEYIERDNASEKLGHPPVTKDSSEHTFSIAAKWRPSSHVNIKADYKLELVNDPYTHKHAYCPKQLPDFDNDKNNDGWPDIWYSKNWYSKYVYGTRQYDMSTQPDTAHDLSLKADWILNEKVMLQANLRYYYGENNELDNYDYEREVFTGGVNLTLTPLPNLGINLGYNYYWDNTESKFCSAFYHG